MEIPKLEFGYYFSNLFMRYAVNTIISLGIIILIFKDKKGFIFSLKFYSFSFVFLGLILFLLLKYNISSDYMLTFYIRRFLIHPIFLLILVPAFYFQKLKLSSK